MAMVIEINIALWIMLGCIGMEANQIIKFVN
jgi:hypothetical protein